LISSKQQDVVRFDQVCCLMWSRWHLEREGFVQIVRIAMEMNPSGKRHLHRCYSFAELLQETAVKSLHHSCRSELHVIHGYPWRRLYVHLIRAS